MGALEKLRASFRRQQTAHPEDKAISAELGPAKHEGERMTTSATVESTVKHSAEKEKGEKRRALGRGLDSLLPGPRVVSVTASSPGNGGASAQQIPESVRTDNVEAVVPSDKTNGKPGLAVLEAAAVETAAPAAISPLPPIELPAQPASVPPDLRSGPTQSGPTPDEAITAMPQADSRLPLVMHLPIADIDRNPFQTRHVETDEALEELTNSIKATGVLQPIVVRPAAEDGRYILVLGERRLLASKIAGRDTIPAIIRRVSEQQAAEMTIIENLQREDLSPLEQAEAFRVLSEEFKLTQAQIGERVGLSRESVANYMRLLRLPEPALKFLAEGEISFATAKELLKLDDKEVIAKTATEIVEKAMTFDQVEKLVWGKIEPVPGIPTQEKKKTNARWVDPNVRAAQLELERLLAVRVRIRDRKGKGKIVIEYSTVDDYERIVGMLRGRKN